MSALLEKAACLDSERAAALAASDAEMSASLDEWEQMLTKRAEAAARPCEELDMEVSE